MKGHDVGATVAFADYTRDVDALRKQLADAQATVEALQGKVETARHDAVRAFVRGEDKMCLVCGATEPCELKDDPCSPCTFEPTPMELLQANQRLVKQVEALQLERNEAIEAASLPTWVCDGCGRVSSDGWINHVIESLDGTDYEMECPTCGVRDIEEDCALDLVRERDDLQAALDAEREKVKGLEQEAERLRIVNRGHINEGFKDMKTIEELTAAFAKAQAQLSQLQALVRAYFTEPDPHKWTAAYQTLKRMGRALPATPTERGENHSGDDTDMVQKGGGDGE